MEWLLELDMSALKLEALDVVGGFHCQGPKGCHVYNNPNWYTHSEWTAARIKNLPRNKKRFRLGPELSARYGKWWIQGFELKDQDDEIPIYGFLRIMAPHGIGNHNVMTLLAWGSTVIAWAVWKFVSVNSIDATEIPYLNQNDWEADLKITPEEYNAWKLISWQGLTHDQQIAVQSTVQRSFFSKLKTNCKRCNLLIPKDMRQFQRLWEEYVESCR